MAEILEIISALGGLITSSSFSSNKSNINHNTKKTLKQYLYNIKKFLSNFHELFDQLIEKLRLLNKSTLNKNSINYIFYDIIPKLDGDYQLLNKLYIDNTPKNNNAPADIEGKLDTIVHNVPQIMDRMALNINIMVGLMKKKEYTYSFTIKNNYFSINKKSGGRRTTYRPSNCHTKRTRRNSKKTR